MSKSFEEVKMLWRPHSFYKGSTLVVGQLNVLTKEFIQNIEVSYGK